MEELGSSNTLNWLKVLVRDEAPSNQQHAPHWYKNQLRKTTALLAFGDVAAYAGAHPIGQPPNNPCIGRS